MSYYTKHTYKKYTQDIYTSARLHRNKLGNIKCVAYDKGNFAQSTEQQVIALTGADTKNVYNTTNSTLLILSY